MTATTLRASDLVALHNAASDGSLELLYQPEIDLQTGAIVAMEALLRWHHGQEGTRTPAEFLDLAEHSGDMTPISAWVLEEAAAEAERWKSVGGAARQLFVNVSASQLVAPGFVDDVVEVMERHGLPAGSLGIEVTEGAITMLGGRALPLLAELRSAGVVLAVDDFGTWYSTLGALEELPIHAVKLDQRYVRGVGGDLDGDTIVASVIALAHARGLYVVAEGVESWAESARLTELGCDRAHGFLFASAQRADKARWMLSQGQGWRVGTVPTPR
ncbi:MAG: EAL domain-containing protein [Actinobacteria bacterium]|nr:EAL domain-containing protein [Actinomycetota bacterium]MCA1720614.1 EAL domain-containing protein [Actinomycetota bacterium]